LAEELSDTTIGYTIRYTQQIGVLNWQMVAYFTIFSVVSLKSNIETFFGFATISIIIIYNKLLNFTIQTQIEIAFVKRRKRIKIFRIIIIMTFCRTECCRL
jgi:hypothetical protein